MNTPRLHALMTQVKAKLDAQGRGSRADLARYLKVAPQHVARWLSGTREPSAENALALLEWVKGHSRNRANDGGRP